MVRLIIVGEIRWALVSPEEAESMLIGSQAELSKESESSLRGWGGRSNWATCLRFRICGVVVLVICLLNIGFITSVGVQVCDRRPSVRRVLWFTMHNKLSQD
jgi:hypothetical protein